MAQLRLVVSTVLAFHIHIDDPEVHPPRQVSHQAFEDGSASLRLPVLELELTIPRHNSDVLSLRQRLAGLTEDFLRIGELQIVENELLAGRFTLPHLQ